MNELISVLGNDRLLGTQHDTHEQHECTSNASIPEVREEEYPYNNEGYFCSTLEQRLPYTVTLK